MGYKLTGMYIRPNGTEQKIRPTGPVERPDIDTYTQAQSVSYPFSGIHGLCVSGDGTYLYLGGAGSTLRQYSMTSKDLSTLSQVNSIAWDTRGLWISSDGADLYSVEGSSPYVRRLNMSTAWDIFTGTVTGNTSGESVYTGCAVSSDLSKIYRGGDYHNSKIYWSTMTSGDVTSLSWQEVAISTPIVSSYNCESVYDLKISPTGRKLFVNQIYNNDNYGCITQYTLSTPRDLSTATYDNKMLVLPNNKGRWGFDLDADGVLYACSLSENVLYKYTSS